MKPTAALRVLFTTLALCAAGGAHAADCTPSNPNGGGVPAFANLTVPGGVLACAGFYEGNVNSGSADDLAVVQDFLGDVAWAGYGLTSTGRIEQINTSGGTINFATPLSGLTLVGFHWGNFGGPSVPGGNVTAFYLFDAGTNLDTFQVNVTPGLSNAAIWAMAPVPEPGTYALLAAGLAGIGFVARRRTAR